MLCCFPDFIFYFYFSLVSCVFRFAIGYSLSRCHQRSLLLFSLTLLFASCARVCSFWASKYFGDQPPVVIPWLAILRVIQYKEEILLLQMNLCLYLFIPSYAFRDFQSFLSFLPMCHRIFLFAWSRLLKNYVFGLFGLPFAFPFSFSEFIFIYFFPVK